MSLLKHIFQCIVYLLREMFWMHICAYGEGNVYIYIYVMNVNLFKCMCTCFSLIPYIDMCINGFLLPCPSVTNQNTYWNIVLDWNALALSIYIYYSILDGQWISENEIASDIRRICSIQIFRRWRKIHQRPFTSLRLQRAFHFKCPVTVWVCMCLYNRQCQIQMVS